MAPPIFENYLDVLGVSKTLGLHPETVKRLIREGKLVAIKFGNKWLIERESLAAFAMAYNKHRGRGRPKRQHNL